MAKIHKPESTEIRMVEDYLYSLISSYRITHETEDIKIFFSENKWGLWIDYGDPIEIGTLKQVENWLKTHCEECEFAWKTNFQDSISKNPRF